VAAAHNFFHPATSWPPIQSILTVFLIVRDRSPVLKTRLQSTISFGACCESCRR